MTNKQKLLSIDRKFDSLINPKPIRSQSASTEEIERHNRRLDDWQQQRQSRFDQIEARLNAGHAVDPFKVWKTGNKLVIVDGRHLEYEVLRKLKLSYQTTELKFANRDEAEAHLIMTTLRGPQLSTAHRCEMAMKLAPVFAKLAKQQQGRRTDLFPISGQKFHPVRTDKELAVIAGVGKDRFSKFRQFKDKGKQYFSNRYEELYNSLVCDEMSVNQVWRKLRNAQDKERDVLNFAAQTGCKAAKGRGQKTKAQKLGSSNAKFRNPDLSKGFENEIYCEDALQTLKRLPAKQASLFFFSPPYNVNTDYNGKQYLQRYADYLQYLGDVIEECSRILVDGGRLVINIAPVHNLCDKDQQAEMSTPIFADLIDEVRARKTDLKYRTNIIWFKRYAFGQRPKNTNITAKNPSIYTSHEFLLVFSKTKWELAPSQPKAPSDLTFDEYQEWGRSVWTIAPQSPSKGNHPCPFPPELCRRVIKLFSFVGDLVIDPYVGTGTTTAVAAELGRRWFGCDLDRDYCERALRRTRQDETSWQKTIQQRQKPSKRPSVKRRVNGKCSSRKKNSKKKRPTKRRAA